LKKGQVWNSQIKGTGLMSERESEKQSTKKW